MHWFEPQRSSKVLATVGTSALVYICLCIPDKMQSTGPSDSRFILSGQV